MPRLAEVMVSEGLISGEQLERCESLRTASGGALATAVLSEGFATGRQLLELLALPLSEPITDFVPEGLPPALRVLLPGEMAFQLKCLPVHDNGSVLSVAFANEVDDLELERLAAQTGRQIEAFLTDPSLLDAAYPLLYGGGGEEQAAVEDSVVEGEAPAQEGAAAEESGSDLESMDLSGSAAEGEEEQAEGGSESELQVGDIKGAMSEALGEVQIVEEKNDRSNAYGIAIEANSPPVVKLVNGILIKSLAVRASDIHIEPQEKELRVRVRIDGDMHALMRLPKVVSQGISSRLKIMSNMDITERRLPLDGRFKVQVGAGNVVEFRVSTLPSAHGEKIVMRVLGGSKIKGDTAGLGFNERDLGCVEEAVRSSCGLVLVTGPTGSGKTTTLYTMLKALNTPDRNVVTAEDPIEYNLPGLTQVAVNPAAGFTFEKALRAFLRQDPDVILVGEIRDLETAEISAKAAMTGHIVLSTLHTNDAPSTLLRLGHMGVPPFLIASSLRMVIAQRLVRVLCPSCRVELKPEEADKLGLADDVLAKLGKTYRGRGCEECHGVGTRGRRPVFEVLPIESAAMKHLLLEPDAGKISALARYEGMKTLRENALDLASQGVVSIAEALKVGAA
ncbi:MAG: Flp pilus assembly complex ATPase component TadA [Elusimicrobia bacterium]|nr:Flp pilus assembly complex ATPase component TadA [Elusimicrobiota bacterium]